MAVYSLTVMKCNNCGGAVKMVEPHATETELGEAFTERYECENCGGVGTLSGTVGKTTDLWQRGGILK